MPSNCHHSYGFNFKLKIVAEAEAVNNNHKIAHENNISESIVRKWCNQQRVLFSGELWITAKWASIECCQLKDLSWISCYQACMQISKVCSKKFAFLLKLISVLQAVFLLIHSNKGLNLMQSSLHLRPKGSAFSLFSLKNKCPFLVFLTVSSAKIVVLSSCCTKIPGYKTHPYFSTT